MGLERQLECHDPTPALPKDMLQFASSHSWVVQIMAVCFASSFDELWTSRPATHKGLRCSARVRFTFLIITFLNNFQPDLVLCTVLFCFLPKVLHEGMHFLINLDILQSEYWV